jgi:hypothetical protein
LLHAHERLEKGKEIFQALPGEVRREFGQSPAEFFNFVNNPENSERLAEVLPALAAPGTQMPSVRRSSANQEDPDPDPAPPGPAPAAAQPPPENPE